jgi:predicted ATPase/DNA-binding SARP family transcriptional activator/Tfp pilus assembly protein PilF
MWTIHLLGGLTVHSDLRQVTRFRTQKAASLLAYLAVHPMPQPRETLIDLLWPDAEPEAGRHNLSNALSFLRHLLEPPGVPPGTVILADRASVRLNPAAITVDVLDFESDLAKAKADGLSEGQRLDLLLRAVERYQGALLPGFYEEWIAPETLRLESLFVQAVVQAVPLLVQAGKREVALAYAQRAVRADPLSEEATRCLMQAFSASGQPAQALRAYRQLETRLQAELDARPSLRLQRLAEHVGPSHASGTIATVPESMPLVEPGLAVVSAASDWAAPAEAREGADLVGAAPRGRLVGAEFLLRTTARFFGRQEEVARLGRMLSAPRTRLVTLTGPGGTGKTRLALEMAAHLVETPAATSGVEAPTSAVFVSLASLTDPERLFEAILRSLGVVPAANQDPLDQLVSVLEAHPYTLLILDNFEQLAEEGALHLQALLGKSAGVKLLVTSRQKLHLEGEREYRLAPLPTSGGAQSLEALLEVASIALFVDRGQAVRPDFQLTERNAVAVAQLCDYLEGLPLAIELAAARVSVFSPARILEQVQANRLGFLATRRRDAISRQRTLRAALDWSYQLLSEQEQAFLAGLSAFRGGWTLGAAQAVCALSEPATLEMLTLLRDSSLIQVTDTEEGLRFKLLETIREYALERLMESGEEDAVRGRHRDYFMAYAEQAEPELTGPEQARWLDCLEIEYENLRAAFTWSLRRSEESRRTGQRKATEAEPPLPVSVPLRFCAALRQFWSTRGHLREGRAWCDAALNPDGAQEQTAARGKALNTVGALAWLQGDNTASRAYHAESLTLFREIGYRRGIADSLNNLGVVAVQQSDYAAARAYHTESLTLFREIGDRSGTAASLNGLGVVAREQGEYAAARTNYEESLLIRRQMGDRRGMAASLNNLGMVVLDGGDYAAARAYHEESLVIRRQIGDRRGIALSLNNLGLTAVWQSDYATARAYQEESLVIQQEIGDRRGMAASLNVLGEVVFDQGDYAAAQAYQEQALLIQRELGDRRGIALSLNNLGHVVFEQGDNSIAKTLLEESLAIQRELGDKRGVAISVDCFASLAASDGLPAKAARLWGAAEALREEIGALMPPGERGRYEVRVGAAREVLGETAFAAEWVEGRTMTRQQAIAFALTLEPEAPLHRQVE